jgi:hypothetical protein
MKKLLTKIIIGTLAAVAFSVFLFAPKPLLAQDTNEPSPTEAPTDQSIEDKLREILIKQAGKVESVLGELTNQRRGFVGQVTRVSEETLGLDVQGETRIVPLDDQVSLLRAGVATTAEKIEIGSWALVLGLMNGDSFTPKEITFSTVSPLPKPQVVHLGSIKDIKATSLDFQARGQEEIITTDLTRNTVYQDNTGEEVDLDQFVEDDQVLLVGYKEESDTIVTVIRALAPFTRGE